MHKTAEQNIHRFFNTYIDPQKESKILEIGSYIGGFNIRSLSTNNHRYTGLDIRPGPGVDIVTQDPHHMPFDNNSFDFIISSSCFEHTKFFWQLFVDIIRVLKPTGLFYLNAPSGGEYHKYPIDAWRFFPDSGFVLAEWASLNGHNNCGVVEQYTSHPESDIWSDYVSIFIKDLSFINDYHSRIIDSFKNFHNGSIYPHNKIINLKHW